MIARVGVTRYAVTRYDRGEYNERIGRRIGHLDDVRILDLLKQAGIHQSVPHSDFAVLATAASCCAARAADLCVFQGLLRLKHGSAARDSVASGHLSVLLRDSDSVGATPIGSHEGC
jgi:hypothetical protein